MLSLLCWCPWNLGNEIWFLLSRNLTWVCCVEGPGNPAFTKPQHQLWFHRCHVAKSKQTITARTQDIPDRSCRGRSRSCPCHARGASRHVNNGQQEVMPRLNYEAFPCVSMKKVFSRRSHPFRLLHLFGPLVLSQCLTTSALTGNALVTHSVSHSPLAQKGNS